MIEVQIIFSDQDLRVRIRDDGIGVEEQTVEVSPRSDHWGLQGMRERAKKKIGAQFNFCSRAGAGTEIELTIPATAAYPRRVARSRCELLRRLVGAWQ